MKVRLAQLICMGFALAGLLVGAPPALADGCYMPERAVRKIPEIPAQRAVVVWKDGEETLFISSALDSESQKLGWIIPLPAVPDTIERETPGALKTLNFCIQPKITHDPVPGLPSFVFWAVIANLLLWVALFRSHRFLALLVFIMVGALFAGLLVPALSGGRSTVAQGTTLQVEKTAKVGSYDISVLRARKAADLDSWLEENGFAALPEAAAQTIAEYVRDGWVFAAVKFVRRDAGMNSPHPLRMSFKAKEAVYPLKLTAAAGGATTFELFVIADERLSCRLLTEEFCDRYGRKWYSSQNYETKVAYEGIETGTQVGHPVICGMMWDGCILTKLSGTIRSEKMTDDLRFSGKPFRAHRRHVYTWAGAKEVALMLLAALMGAALFISMIMCAKRIREPQGKAWYVRRVLLRSWAMAALCAMAFYGALPKLPPSEVQVSHWARYYMHPTMLAGAIARQFDEHPEFARQTEEQIGEHLQASDMTEGVGKRARHARTVNVITGDELKVEDTPGNFTVERGVTNIAIRIYDRSGRPLIYSFPASEPSKGSD